MSLLSKTSFIWFYLVFSHSALAATQISTCADLQNMNLDLNGQYELSNDVDCGTFSFIPVGTSSNPFKGILQGRGHKISNLYINEKNTSYVGLFGFTQDALISQLVLENVQIIGTLNTGSLIGFAKNTKVTEVFSSGNIKSTNNNFASGYIGGLAGIVDHSTFIQVSSSVNVSIENTNQFFSAGGLVGSLNFSSITQSQATGNVYAAIIPPNGLPGGGIIAGGLVGDTLAGISIVSSYATGDLDATTETEGVQCMGGLIGSLDDSTTNLNSSNIVTQSYATGNIGTKSSFSTRKNLGGLIGVISGPNKCPDNRSDCLTKVENSFSTGNVQGTGEIGGLIGRISSTIYLASNYSIGRIIITSGASVPTYSGGLVGSSTFTAHSNYDMNNYWDTQTSGLKSSALGDGKTTSEMYQKNTFNEWNFKYIWDIDEDRTYPCLIGLSCPPQPKS
jgi:hypothetical protein